jgi:hypothetical protein
MLTCSGCRVERARERERASEREIYTCKGQGVGGGERESVRERERASERVRACAHARATLLNPSVFWGSRGPGTTVIQTESGH